MVATPTALSERVTARSLCHPALSVRDCCRAAALPQRLTYRGAGP